MKDECRGVYAAKGIWESRGSGGERDAPEWTREVGDLRLGR